MKQFCTLLFLLYATTLSFGQCLDQDFSNLSLGSYTNGDFTLDGLTWSCQQAIQENATNSAGGIGKAIRINDDKVGAHVTLPALDAPQSISFDYRELNSGGGIFVIQKSTDGGATYIDVCTQAYSGTTYQSYTCDINETFNGVLIRILSDDNLGHLIIDNLSVSCTSSSVCSISNIQVETACNGDDAELTVNFNAQNTTGFFEYTIDGGATYNAITNGGTFTIAGPTLPETKTIEVRDTDNITCSASATFDIPTCDSSLLTTSDSILITEVADPADYIGNRFVEICNRGTSVVDISGWMLELYNNGRIEADGPSFSTAVDSGVVLEPGDCFLFAQTAYGSLFSCNFQPATVGFNGNDAIVLRDSNGRKIDIYGEIGVDGTGESWEFKDAIATRNNNVSTASLTWSSTEWAINLGNTADSTPCDDDYAFIFTETVDNCETTTTPIAVSGNDFTYITVDNGKVIAAINPNGNDLGNVTGSVYISSTSRTDGERTPYLDRSIFLKPTNNLGATVRYYFTQAELDALITASNANINGLDDVNSIDDINVTQVFDAGCGPKYHGDIQIKDLKGIFHETVITGSDFIGLYVEFTVGQFSGFSAHGSKALILPVELTTFDANEHKGSVVLNWATASEKENKQFNILRSNNGKEFSVIGSVLGSGTTNSYNSYSFVDKVPLSGRYYYKLESETYKGRRSESSIVVVEVKPKQFNLLAFSSNSFVLEAKYGGVAQVKVYNTQGQLVDLVYVIVEKGRQDIALNTVLKPSVYLVELSLNDELTTGKFVVN